MVILLNAFENFIIKSQIKYNNKYDYSKFHYIDMKTESIIICPIHGEFLQSPRNHLCLIEGCPKCRKILDLNKRKEDFINKANKRYNFYFDYSKFVYIDAKTKSVIICPKHGAFIQSPDKHLQGINPCPLCEKELKKERCQNKSEYTKRKISEGHKKEIDEFLRQAQFKFGNKFEYDFTNYSGIMGNDIRIKCPIHGWFNKQPRNFLTSHFGCTECGMSHRDLSKTKSYDSFVVEATKLFNGKYTYPETNQKIFKNRNSIIEIECKKHGVFKKKAIKHLSGQGCFKCKIEKLVEDGILVGGYNSELFKNNIDIANKIGYLYYLKINNGEFYKIGITVNLKRRVSSLSSLFNAKVEIIKTVKGRLEDMYSKEQLILRRFKFLRVYTKKSTELFSKDISKYDDFNNIFI